MCRPTRYIMLGALFAFVVAYQVRASWKTVHVETNLDFYVPLTLARFTNRIDASWDSRLRSGYQIIAVNGHPFRGASLYFRELWESQHQAVSLRDASWRACVITVRDGDSKVRAVEVWPAHCTCGVPGKTEAVMFWFGLPLCCILIGFTTVLLRPGSRAAWAFLLLMLSLSQLRLFQDLYPGFQQTIDPMSWSDWMRPPSVAYRSFVQHAWPAALLVLARCLYRSRRRAHGITVAVVGVFIGYAVAQAILDVAWSENYRPFSGLYRFLQEYATELTIMAMISVAAIAAVMNRRLGAVFAILALSAASAFYWIPAPLPSILDVAGATQGPPLHRTDSLIAALFTAGCIVMGLLFYRCPKMAITGVLLCSPMLAFIVGASGNYWFPFRFVFSNKVTGFGLASAGIGLALIAWSLVRVDNASRAVLP